MYLLTGIALPDIRRYVCARMEKTKQETNEAHALYGQHPAEKRLKSRNCFLRSVKPAEFSPKVIRCNEWLRRLQTTPHKVRENYQEDMTVHGQRGGVLIDYVHDSHAAKNRDSFNDIAKKYVKRWKTQV